MKERERQGKLKVQGKDIGLDNRPGYSINSSALLLPCMKILKKMTQYIIVKFWQIFLKPSLVQLSFYQIVPIVLEQITDNQTIPPVIVIFSIFFIYNDVFSLQISLIISYTDNNSLNYSLLRIYKFQFLFSFIVKQSQLFISQSETVLIVIQHNSYKIKMKSKTGSKQPTQTKIASNKITSNPSDKKVTQKKQEQVSKANMSEKSPDKSVEVSQKQTSISKKSEKPSEKKIESTSIAGTNQSKKSLDPPKRDLPKNQNVSIRPFLQSNFQQAINQGLKQVLKHQPEDPIKFLGQYLLKYSTSK